MTKKRRTTGFGRCYADVPIIVGKPIDQYFKDEEWIILSEDDNTTTFEYTCTNRYVGNDETVVESLFRDYPEGLGPIGKESKHVKLGWGNAVY